MCGLGGYILVSVFAFIVFIFILGSIFWIIDFYFDYELTNYIKRKIKNLEKEKGNGSE